MNKKFDVVVAGGGISGLTAGLVCARQGRSTLILTGDVLGGHLLSIEKIEGFPGYPDGVAGYELCPATQQQAAQAGAEFAMSTVTTCRAQDDHWVLSTGSGDYTARAVIAATGTVLKTLGVQGETLLRGKGVSQCASCDAPMLSGREVVVVGGGDSALQEALTLADHVSRVTIVHRGEQLSAQASFRARVESHPRIELQFQTEVSEILGDEAVTGVRVHDSETSEINDLEAAAVFVFIGLTPNAAFLDGELSLGSAGHVPTDGQMHTELRGVFAAGTVRAGAAGRAVAAAGDGAIAALAADRFLANGAWPT